MTHTKNTSKGQAQPENVPLNALRHHVTGAIKRGEKQAITEVKPKRARSQVKDWTVRMGDHFPASATAENVRTDKSEIAAVTRYFNKSVAASASQNRAESPILCGSCGLTLDELASFWGGNKGMLTRIKELETYSQKLETHAERLAEACKSLIARLDYAHEKIVWNTKDHEAIEKGLLALAEYEGRSKDQ